MNSTKKDIVFAKNIKWLGRAGIVDVRGIRIAYVSGIDSDILGSEIMNADSKKNYLGNYFLASDIQDILLQNEESENKGVDILLTC